MIEEALKYLAELGRKTTKVQILEPFGEHSRKLETVYADGTREETTCLRSPRTYLLKTLDSLVTSLKIFQHPSEPHATCVVFCRLGQITARPFELSEDDLPQDSVVWQFDRHPCVDWLSSISSSVNKSASELRTLLRIGLGDVTLDPPELLSMLSIVNFDEQSEMTDEDRDTIRRVGKTITAKVRGIDSLPDSFRVTFQPSPFFPSLSAATVTIGLRAVPESSHFALTPKAGDLALVIAVAESEIVQEVSDRIIHSGFDVGAVLAGLSQ